MEVFEVDRSAHVVVRLPRALGRIQPKYRDTRPRDQAFPSQAYLLASSPAYVCKYIASYIDSILNFSRRCVLR
jgi:hypothetical protein